MEYLQRLPGKKIVREEAVHAAQKHHDPPEHGHFGRRCEAKRSEETSEKPAPSAPIGGSQKREQTDRRSAVSTTTGAPRRPEETQERYRCFIFDDSGLEVESGMGLG